MMREVDALLEPLLQELELDYEGLRVVAIGGGHGLAQALSATLDYADVITAVVSVADNGGSSGRIVPALDMAPPGDVRRALLALSPQPSVWRQLIEYRFEDADVAGHSLGNLILAALTEMSGDFEDAIRTAGRLLGAKGAVVPVSDQPLTLHATIGGVQIDGQVAVGKTPGEITDVWITPDDARGTRAAVSAIGGADQILLGPGSLYTSVIAPLMVPGIAAAINEAPGKLVYVCNLITQDAETLGMSGEDHVEALLRHSGIRAPDAIVAHDGTLDPPTGHDVVRIDAADEDSTIERADLVDEEAEWPQHDPARLGAVLRRLA